LEERVQILEGQNKKLIDELKALKEFYTQHKKDYPEHNIWGTILMNLNLPGI